MTPHQRDAESQPGHTSNDQSVTPRITLPKGGGAIRGIDEQFSVNPVTGTASFSVPLPTPPGRSAFAPQLALTYDSGAGNSPFGLGWNISIPAISRKTDKGLPRYEQANEPDTFLLSGAEDLVPFLARRGTGWQAESFTGVGADSGYTIRRYRPRVEGLFARIECLTAADGTIHWRSITKENVTTLYGRSSACRIAAPEDATRVFTWLIEESWDDKGNIIRYTYTQEDLTNVSATAPHEQHRLNRTAHVANRYLSTISYGNRVPVDDPAFDSYHDWLFCVVLDYGAHDQALPTVEPNVEPGWPCRPDPFSSYRAGFEVRTYRRCERVLVFHHFAELGETPCLVRSLALHYTTPNAPEERPAGSYLREIVQTSYVRDGTTYHAASFPPLTFAYTEPSVDTTIYEANDAALDNLPVGLDGTQYQWLDLNSEGIAGVLMEQAGAWFYKRTWPSRLHTVTSSGRRASASKRSPLRAD